MKQLEDIITSSINYLQGIILNDEFLKFRSFYGDSFCLSLMKREKTISKPVEEKLISRYRSLDKTNSEFHFEFNNYAFIDVYFEDKNMMNEVLPLQFKNTPCTNWTLLRNCTKLKFNKSDIGAIEDTKSKLDLVQDKYGLIFDDPGVKSFQYHCFSAAMVGEIYELTKDDYFLDSFNKAVSFIRNFILPNGKTLHIGRGQEQTFGYGALAYILALSYKFNKDSRCLSDLKKVLNLLEHEQRPDGSLPLVIGAKEPHPAYLVAMDDVSYCGWYPYNNFFDYLPFMTFFLSKTKSVLNELEVTELALNNKVDLEYRDSNFIKIVKEKYIAILSKPGGYWSNDQVVPLLYSNGELLNPVYGGEQFQESLYKEKDLGIPFVRGTRFTLRFKSRSFLFGDKLILIGPLGIFLRRYNFKDDEIVMKDLSFSFFFIRNSFASFFYNPNKIDTSFSRKVISTKESYSSSGKLKISLIPCWIKIRMKF